MALPDKVDEKHVQLHFQESKSASDSETNSELTEKVPKDNLTESDKNEITASDFITGIAPIVKLFIDYFEQDRKEKIAIQKELYFHDNSIKKKLFQYDFYLKITALILSPVIFIGATMVDQTAVGSTISIALIVSALNGNLTGRQSRSGQSDNTNG